MKCQYTLFANSNLICEKDAVYFFILNKDTYCCCEDHGSGHESVTYPAKEISKEEYLTLKVLQS